jgi:GH35 family endo-1,4-beta-xylanase
MSRWIPFVLGVLLAGSTFGVRPPSGGRQLKFDRSPLSWQLYGAKRNVAELSEIKVSGQPFRRALQVEISERTQREYDLQLGGKIEEPIRKDDVLLLSFYIRCTESADESAFGRCHLAGQANRPSRSVPLFGKNIVAGKKWKQILVPFAAPIDNKAGYSVAFRFGGTKPQTLQIAKLEVVNYGKKRKLEHLPISETRYPGMEPDAPWRKAAAARIEQYRKADLQITVVNRNGKPVPRARVHVELKKHAYGFGVALGLNSMFSERHPEDAEKYRAAVEDLFNKVVFENRMKWRFQRDNDAQLEKAIAWCAERGLPIRGHCMVWAAWKRLPRGMEQEFAGRDEEFKSAINEHVRKMATAYPDAFVEWDVVNELYTQHEFVDMFGKDVVVDWFRTAKAANPNFTRYINDYAILAGYNQPHQDGYFEWIKYLLEQGAPVEGIGLQGHFRAPVPPEEILRRLDRFAQFGLEMQITEYDFEETDEMLQARFTRDFMTAVFSHPQTTGILTWCLWEKAASKPQAAFFSSDWKKKRIAQAWEYMVEKEWHTEKSLVTGREGTAKLRGFLGDYEISVAYAGRKKTVSFPLTKEKGTCLIQLD